MGLQNYLIGNTFKDYRIIRHKTPTCFESIQGRKKMRVTGAPYIFNGYLRKFL